MSSITMLTSFNKLYPILRNCGLNPKTLALIPSAAKKYKLDELRYLLLQINEVNLELQKSDSIKINLAYIRDLFDGLIELCPSLASKKTQLMLLILFSNLELLRFKISRRID
jgi:hypothetical protein